MVRCFGLFGWIHEHCIGTDARVCERGSQEPLWRRFHSRKQWYVELKVACGLCLTRSCSSLYQCRQFWRYGRDMIEWMVYPGIVVDQQHSNNCTIRRALYNTSVAQFRLSRVLTNFRPSSFPSLSPLGTYWILLEALPW